MLREANEIADILSLPQIEAPAPIDEQIVLPRMLDEDAGEGDDAGDREVIAHFTRGFDKIFGPRCPHCGHELTHGLCANCGPKAA